MPTLYINSDVLSSFFKTCHARQFKLSRRFLSKLSRLRQSVGFEDVLRRQQLRLRKRSYHRPHRASTHHLQTSRIEMRVVLVHRISDRLPLGIRQFSPRHRRHTVGYALGASVDVEHGLREALERFRKQPTA